ncbi:poly-gamma-glutamate synthase PgsB [candidate division WOR-3 bacterium]|nr:poly-gamma-glutamate synthase PgsB [candidate division WOR-3 bacterium]
MFLGIYAVLILIVLYVFFLRIEKINHEKRVKSIPLRIWVNGSRGKSSVTRLIAAGLRAGGKRVIAKTTGTQARFITDSKHEQPVIRLGMPNIREQVKIFKRAIVEEPDAIVLECMALRPDLQYSEAVHIVKPTAVVITNIRADHLEVMGPSIKDVAKNFLNALPRNSTLFVGEKSMLRDQESTIKKKNTQVFISETEKISDDVMNNFAYIEHKSNVAIALDVCRHFDVNEKDALAAMHNANPDPGVLQRYSIALGEKEVTIVNAMAANDPESTFLIWQMIDKEYPEVNILINCRHDRVDRTFQMADLVRDRIKGDHYILTGTGTDILARKLRNIIERTQMLDIGGKKPEETVNAVADFVADNSLIFAMGNTVGFGEEMMQRFLQRKKG